jgi:hypothetical protein
MEIHPGKARLLIPLFELVLMLASSAVPVFPRELGVPAKLTFSKVFQGGDPEYVAITVDSNGSGTFEGRKLDEPESPCPLQLSPETTHQIFALAAQLQNFQSIDLESHKKVANMGQKTLTYQGGESVNRVVFNYTENRTARVLVDIFESIATVEEHVAALEFQMKYEPLSLSEELLEVQRELDNKNLIDPEILIPTLEKIAHNSRFLHLAQVRAQQIIASVQPDH